MAEDRRAIDTGRVVNIATGAPVATESKQPRPLGNFAAYSALGVIAGILGAATFWTLLDARAGRPTAPDAAAGQTVGVAPAYGPVPMVSYPELMPYPSGAPLGAAPLMPPPGELAAPPQQAVMPGDVPVFAAPDSGPVMAAPASSPAAITSPGRKQAPTLIFDSGDVRPESSLVIPGAPPAAQPEAPAPSATGKGSIKPGRAALTRGTMIPAVLESAVDTSQSGGVRAMVSVDVRSADGRALLVPRGSRLFGQYRTVGSGSTARAELSWTRLQRPDGSSENLGGAIVSQLAAVPGGDDSRVRVRPGEPIRAMAARSVEITPAGK